MNSGRRTGIILSVLGFAVAVIAGLYMALTVTAGETEGGQFVTTALIAFIPVALLVGSGLYLYVKNAPEEIIPESTMPKQRELLDMLRQDKRVDLAKASHLLSVDHATMRAMVEELIALRVFSGYIDWEIGVLALVDADILREATRCMKCKTPISLKDGSVVCATCGTEYFVVSLPR